MSRFPQECRRCDGTGTRYWGALVNGKWTRSGPCFLCGGSGRVESAEQVREFIRAAREHIFRGGP